MTEYERWVEMIINGKPKEKKVTTVASTSDERTVNNVMRHAYPCSKGHTMSFQMPSSATASNWGFYRRYCKDREERSKPKAESSEYDAEKHSGSYPFI